MCRFKVDFVIIFFRFITWLGEEGRVELVMGLWELCGNPGMEKADLAASLNCLPPCTQFLFDG